VIAKTTDLRKQLLVMAIGAGASISLLYFCQPLLSEMARSFTIPDKEMHWVPAMAQLGAALGTMFILPLGDRMERRGLAVRMCWVLASAAVCMAFAPGFSFLLVSSLLVGCACCIPHLLVPIATLIAPPDLNASAIATVMSGLLVGVLLGRTVAGILIGGWVLIEEVLNRRTWTDIERVDRFDLGGPERIVPRLNATYSVDGATRTRSCV